MFHKAKVIHYLGYIINDANFNLLVDVEGFFQIVDSCIHMYDL